MSRAVLAITDKMEAQPQPPLLILQARTGMKELGLDLSFSLSSAELTEKEYLGAYCSWQDHEKAQRLLQLCSENNS